jgi:hypothetical protein
MANDMEKPQDGEKKNFKEITVKFGKGLVGEPFSGKDGKEYRQIKIPNQDENDKSPWATFVVKANSVHEDQFGKGMWVKLPAEGTTTVRKAQVVGQDQLGKNVYENTKEKVPNKELKSRVEFYKNRNSLKERLSEKKDSVLQSRSDKPKEHSKTKENVL